MNLIINQQLKIANAIAFFATKFKQNYGFWPAQMWIYKLLALLDYRILMATGRPCLGLEYYAMDNGPVPMSLYDNRQNSTASDIYLFESLGGRRYNISALKEPDLDCFSDRAVEEMENLSQEFIFSGKGLNYLINATHQLKAWQAARNDAQKCCRGRMLMEYADAFEINPAKKAPEDLSWQEEAFLAYEDSCNSELAAAE